jgi:hypothetical protein
MLEDAVWTTQTLKILHDQRISHLDEKVELQFKLNQLAVNKAEAKMDIRLDAFNEWRQQNKDERSMFASKQEVVALTRLVYVGLGIILAIEALLRFIPKIP